MRRSFRSAALAAIVATAMAAPARATGDGGDNGMTPWYGDSWANVESRAPEVQAVPSLQAQEEKASASAVWGQVRESARERTAHLRESTSNAFHRMTGPPAASSRDATSDPATTDGGATLPAR